MEDVKYGAIKELREESINMINLHPKDLIHYVRIKSYVSFIVFVKNNIDFETYRRNRFIIREKPGVSGCYLET